MICPNCNMRWADFPSSDFIVNEKGIIPITISATSKRHKAFKSDEIKYCGCMEQEYQTMDFVGETPQEIGVRNV